MQTDRPLTVASAGTRALLLRGAAWVALILGLALVLQYFYPIGVDWAFTFAELPEQPRQPYTIPTFTNPPWVMLLLPHAWLPVRYSNAVNFLLNVAFIFIIVRRYQGGWQTLLMVFTSPLFFDLARTNNIDWVSLLAVLLPPALALPVLVIKPHAIGGIALIWWKKQQFSLRMLLPLVGITLLSFLIWGFWPLQAGLLDDVLPWNFAPWPLGIPLGLYMLWRAYQSEDELLAAGATPFLTPYIAPYSLAIVLALVGSRYRREAFYVYVGFWVFFVVEARRISLMVGG